MKKYIPSTIILFAFTALLSFNSAAQKKMGEIPAKAHWQLVSNIHQKNIVTVQFYSDDNTLMYQETLTNVKLKVERKKVQKKLNAALNESYQIWSSHAEPDSKNLITKRMNN